MGIKKPFMVRDYWPRFGGRATLLVLLFQVIAVLLTGCVFMAIQLYTHELPLWASLLILFGIVATTNLILFHILLSPLREITSALAHICLLYTSPSPRD